LHPVTRGHSSLSAGMGKGNGGQNQHGGSPITRKIEQRRLLRGGEKGVHEPHQREGKCLSRKGNECCSGGERVGGTVKILTPSHRRGRQRRVGPYEQRKGGKGKEETPRRGIRSENVRRSEIGEKKHLHIHRRGEGGKGETRKEEDERAGNHPPSRRRKGANGHCFPRLRQRGRGKRKTRSRARKKTSTAAPSPLQA